MKFLVILICVTANYFWKQDLDQTNDGFGGLALEAVSNWQTPYAWLTAGGGQIFAEGGFRFNAPENLAALEFISKLRAADCAWLSSSPTNYEAFVTRRALFYSGAFTEIDAQKSALSAAGSSHSASGSLHPT